ncbi:hypothetical protein EWH10_02150 [Sphingobium fuliginis]|nr:hypothetical protein EWH10_02150 [Sphingobium fuliginis]
MALAPLGDAVVEYDRLHLSLYAALLDAEDSGQPWGEASQILMGIDPGSLGAETCWRSHLERARWIVGEGLAQAVSAFGRTE